jgi:hypothetical protein
MSWNPSEILATESDAGVQPIVFVQCDEYHHFRAEFAVVGGDLVFHFFPPKRPHDLDVYWGGFFPAVLDPVAREAFKAEYPRLKATRITEFEIDSWWFRAYGFGQGLSPPALAYRFLDALERGLDTNSEM